MDVNNQLYKNQGMHALCSLFTVEKGVVKVLLIKRKNEPYKDKWALVGGAVYNNESLEEGMKREIYEKIGVEDVKLYFANLFDEKDRSPVMRMFASSFIGVLDSDKVTILKDTLKTSNAEWFDINNIPPLAYDHEKIIKDALERLKKIILETNILKVLFPNEFVLPELQSVYEAILNKKEDRRNFRKKLINSNLIEATDKMKRFDGNKPAIVYTFK